MSLAERGTEGWGEEGEAVRAAHLRVSRPVSISGIKATTRARRAGSSSSSSSSLAMQPRGRCISVINSRCTHAAHLARRISSSSSSSSSITGPPIVVARLRARSLDEQTCPTASARPSLRCPPPTF